ncbi:polyprenyl synthetase family protein [bacterium]|nr:polyprenyl synthetase family protein [bacterium]
MRSILSSDVKMVDKVVRYIVNHRGKGLRPILTLLSARLFGVPSQRTIKAAVIAELLHTATLVHDDVVDDAQMRRGFLSINAIWKNKVSVLVGDYLLAKSLTETLDLRDFEVLDILSVTARRMSRGELLQIAKVRKLDITEEVYLDMIGDKTGALLAACCELAAVTSGQNGEVRENLKQFGEKIGLAFQIRDDILDFEGRRSVIGKPIMGDVKEKKLTLPLIHAIRSAKWQESRKIIKKIRRGLKRSEKQDVLDFIHQHKGIEYASEAALNLKDEALTCLDGFPESPERKLLVDFTNFAVTRVK